MSILTSRLESLVLARAATLARKPTTTEIAKSLRRFAPLTLSDADWSQLVAGSQRSLQEQGGLDANLQVADATELERRIGKHSAKTWSQFADRVFPLIGLGVPMADPKLAARLTGRDAWTAAIAGRILGLWKEGPPPSLPTVCDAYAWRKLELTGRPKRCPPEVRALFLQRELHTDAGPPDRLLRLFAARELETPRAELRLLRDALVRNWLLGRTIGEKAAVRATQPSFAADVQSIAREARQGVFGDRKVFIASVWNDLRLSPSWSALTLDDFKHRLVTAHRAGDLVLARADLVAAMNPDLVAASETITDGASFHFIVRENVR